MYIYIYIYVYIYNIIYCKSVNAISYHILYYIIYSLYSIYILAYMFIFLVVDDIFCIMFIILWCWFEDPEHAPWFEDRGHIPGWQRASLLEALGQKRCVFFGTNSPRRCSLVQRSAMAFNRFVQPLCLIVSFNRDGTYIYIYMITKPRNMWITCPGEKSAGAPQ